MTKETLLQKVLALPTIEAGNVAEDHQIIEGDEGSVHYKMTKERFSRPGIPVILTLFSLSVSGPPGKRVTFIHRVAEKLGSPLSVAELPDMPGIHFAVWEASSAERKLQGN